LHNKDTNINPENRENDNKTQTVAGFYRSDAKTLSRTESSHY